MKLADFGVSVLARDELSSSQSGRRVSPLAALLTGEPEVSESTMSPIPAEDLPASARSFRRIPGRPDDLTEVGMLVGTPMYMAPEISFGSRHAQAPSDVFSFGVIAYELIVGEVPFKRPPIGVVVRKETLAIPPALHQRSDLSPELRQLFEAALSVAPAHRPTAAALAAALAPYV